MDNGLFSLKLIDSAPRLTTALSQCEGRFPPLTYLHCINTIQELVSLWRSAKISSTDFLLRLNSFHHRSFIDLSAYPAFPEIRSNKWKAVQLPRDIDILALMSSVNPFQTFDRIVNRGKSRRLSREASLTDIQRTFLPADFFFYSFDEDPAAPIFLRAALESEQRLADWIRLAFSDQITVDVRISQPYFGMLDAKYLCQELVIHTSDSSSILWISESIVIKKGLWLSVHNFFVHHHSGELTISLEQFNDLLHSRSDSILAYVSHLSIGEQGLFFVADLSVGVSLSFRIEYRERGKVGFAQTARIEVDGIGRTVVSDIDFLGATFCGTDLIIWNLINGTVHRRLNFESFIRVIAFDQIFSCLLLSTDKRIVYLNMNGDILCEHVWTNEEPHASAAIFVGVSLSEVSRGGLCGFSNGEVGIVILDFVGKRIRFENLYGLHKHPISEFILHPSKTAVLTVDISGKICIWTSNAIPSLRISIPLFLHCFACNQKPVIARGKRHRVFCGDCLRELLNRHSDSRL
jgi:hypothetical protein